jgi:hypothetical protein
LIQKLVDMKNELLLKEEEIRLLSARDQGEQSSFSQVHDDEVTERQVERAPRERVQNNSGRRNTSTRGSSNTDVAIVEVIAGKVNLRSGPGPEHAPVMHVQRGSRLTVEAKEGEYYRVLSPTGTRAYISAEFVTPVEGDLQSVPRIPTSRRITNQVRINDARPSVARRTAPAADSGTEESFIDNAFGADSVATDRAAARRASKAASARPAVPDGYVPMDEDRAAFEALKKSVANPSPSVE